MSAVRAQAGFTLIELLVVLVIMAVMAAVGVMSLSPNEQAQARALSAKLQGAVQSAYDQASFQQRLILLAPVVSEEQVSLQAWQWRDDAWQQAEGLRELSLPGEFDYQWQLPELAEQNQNFKPPQPGWLFWPSGELSAGSVSWSSPRQRFDNEVYRLSWDEALNFEHRLNPEVP